MKNNKQPALKERIEKALEDLTKGRASMHVPPLDTDVDVVLAECSDRLSELESRCAALAAENEAMKSFGDKLSEMHNDLNGEGTGIQGRAEVACQQVALEAAMDEFDAIKTPATDAFLAEVRAQGVEMLAEHLSGMNISASETSLREFAAQLRKGVQS